MDLVFRTGAPADYDSYRRIVEENKLIDPVEMDAMLVDKANAADGNWFTCALAVCPTDDQSIVGVAYCSYEKIGKNE